MNVDELVVVLALDSSKFTQGQKDALEAFRKTDEEMQKRLSALEARNKNVGYSFNNTTAAAQGLFSALLGGGLAAFASETMTSTAAAGRMAANIGLMTSEYQAFGRTVERNGGNFDTAVGSLKSLNDQVEKLKLTGQASDEFWQFAGTIGANQDEIENPLELMKKFAEYAANHKDDIKMVNAIGQMGGIDQGSINTLLKGRIEFLKEYAEAIKGTATPEQVAAMIKMQDAWVTLEQKMGDVGRAAIADMSPDFDAAASSVSKFTENNKELSVTLTEVLATLVALRSAVLLLTLAGLGSLAGPVAVAGLVAYEATKKFNKVIAEHPASGMMFADAEQPGLTQEQSHPSIPSQTSPGGRDSAAIRELRIRMLAAKPDSKGRWIDPDIAMRVAHGEGFGSFQSSIPGEQSFGDFQLNMSKKGTSLGDQFLKETGKDPRDPRNEGAADKWILDWVRQNGWDPNGHGMHGATNNRIGNWQGVHIESITVNASTNNPRELGRVVGDVAGRKINSDIATQANAGLKN